MRATLCLLGVVPAALAAQQPPSDTVELNPVVVTATRIPTAAANLPVAVTVISGARLREQGIRTVAEALRTVPAANVVVTNAYGSQTSLFLRGGNPGYVKVLIDGVPQNDPGLGTYDFANLTIDNVERIEVVRGPASVLYGSDAVTGVVQVFTRRGVGGARADASVRGGTYGTLAWDAEASEGGQAASYSVSLSRLTSSGVYAFNNQYRNTVFSGLARVAPDDRTEATFSLRYGDARYHFPTDAGGDPVSNNQHQLERGPSVGLDVGHVFSARLDGHITAAWRRDNYRYAIAPNGPTDTTTFPFRSSDWVTREGLDARADLRLFRRDVLTLGTAFERETMEGTTLDASRARNDGAVYLQVVTGPARPVSLTLGARLEDNQRFGTYATYRTGFSLRFAERMRALASIGTGFKEPSLYQNFATGFVRGNPDLRPEHSFSWETGLEYTLPRPALSVRATYFDQRFRNLIQYSDTTVGPDSVNYVNVADAAARGVELAIQTALGARLSLDATYTYLDSRDFAANEPLLRRPGNVASLRLGYVIATRGTASLAAVFTGERDDYDYSTYPAPRVPLPPHTRVDLSGSYEVSRGRGALPGVALTARIENLLNARYEDVKNFPARRRTLLFGGRVRFGS